MLHEYAPLTRGLASLIDEAVGAARVAAAAAKTMGAWNEAAAPLAAVRSLLAPGSALAMLLDKYLLVFGLTCIFHVHEALETNAKQSTKLPFVLAKVAVYGFKQVIAGEVEYAKYKADMLGRLAEHAGYARTDGSSAWTDYLEEHMLSRAWWSTISGRFRALYARWLVETNNRVEAELWSVLQGLVNNLMSTLSFREVLRVLCGLFGDPSSQRRSVVGRITARLRRIVAGRQPARGGYRRERTLRDFGNILSRAALPSPVPYVRFDPRLSPATARVLGAIVIGNGASGLRASAPLPVDAVPMDRLSAAAVHEQGFRPLEARHRVLRDGQLDDDRGRHEVDAGARVQAACAAARRAAAVLPPPLVTGAAAAAAAVTNASTPSSIIAHALRPALPLCSEYSALHARGHGEQRLRRLLHHYGQPEVNGGLAPLAVAAPPEWLVVGERRLSADAAVTALNRFGFLVPESSDWLHLPGASAAVRRAASKAPDVAIVYTVVVSMSAAAWLREYERVFGESGCSLSTRTHEPLDPGFLVALVDAQPMAAAAVRAGRGDEELPAAFVGQWSSSDAAKRCSGLLKHGGPGGCPAVSELVHASTNGAYVWTLGRARVRLTRRILAWLPREPQQDVDMLTSGYQALLALCGVVMLNSSPGAPADGRRYLHDGAGGSLPAAVDDALDAHERAVGVAALASRAGVEGVVQPHLRVVLQLGLALLAARQYLVGGAPPAPALASGSGELVFSQAQCLAAVRAWRGETPRYVQLAVYACTCPARRLRLVCACQHAARLWYSRRTGKAFPVADSEDALYTPAGFRAGAPQQSHAPQRYSLRQAAAAAAAPPPLSRAASLLEAALHLSAAAAVLPHVREGDEPEVLSLARRISGLSVGGAQRGLLDGTDLWPGGIHGVRGGLVTVGEIERQAAMARSELDSLPLDASALLAFAHNVERRRHDQAGGGGGGGSVAAAAASSTVEPLFFPPTSTLQRAALARRAVEVQGSNLALLQQRTDASSAAGGQAAGLSPLPSSAQSTPAASAVALPLSAGPAPAPPEALPSSAGSAPGTGDASASGAQRVGTKRPRVGPAADSGALPPPAPRAPPPPPRPPPQCVSCRLVAGVGAVSRRSLSDIGVLCVACDAKSPCSCASFREASCSPCFQISTAYRDSGRK